MATQVILIRRRKIQGKCDYKDCKTGSKFIAKIPKGPQFNLCTGHMRKCRNSKQLVVVEERDE